MEYMDNEINPSGSLSGTTDVHSNVDRLAIACKVDSDTLVKDASSIYIYTTELHLIGWTGFVDFFVCSHGCENGLDLQIGSGRLRCNRAE